MKRGLKVTVKDMDMGLIRTLDQSEGRFTTKTFGVRLFVSDSNFTCFASVK